MTQIPRPRRDGRFGTEELREIEKKTVA